MQPIEQEIYDIFAKGAVVPTRLPLNAWCKKNVFLPNPPFNPSGFLDLDRSKYLVEPLLALQETNCHEVLTVGVPRSGKTLLSQAFTQYVIKEDPADVLLAIHKKDTIKAFYDVRILPLLHANRIQFADYKPAGKTESATQRLIKFPVGSIKICGAQTAADFTMLGHRVLIGDELHEWKPGMLEQFKRRADEFRYTKKILLISQASEHGMDFHNEFLKGHQAIWGFNCPDCSTEQVYHFTYKREDGTFAGFRFDEIKNERDEWNITETAKTARYECIKCGREFFDPKDRKLLNDCGLYIPQNPNAPEHIRSYLWNAFATANISFSEICEGFLNAKNQVKRNKYDDIRNFRMQVLSEFYHQGMNDNQIELNVGEDLTQEDAADGLKFLSVDVQKDVLYYTILIFNKDKKEIRLADYGKIAKDWEALLKIQLDNGVSYKNVLLDSGNGNDTNEVYRAAASHYKVIVDKTGKKRRQCWCATKGDEPKDGRYYHSVDKTKRLYSPISKQEVSLPNKQEKSFCKLTLFATSGCRSLLQELIDNKHPTWKLFFSPEAASDPVFKEHLQADKPVTVFSKRNNQTVTRWVNPERLDNHYADALNIGILAGVICGYI